MNANGQLLAVLMVVPLMAAPVAALLRPRHLAWLVATSASATTFAAACSIASSVLAGDELSYAMGGWEPPGGIELRVDALGALVLLLVTGASVIALIGGRKSVDTQVDQHRQPLFYAAWITAQAGLAGIVVSGDAFNIFVFLEISSLASYVLIGASSDRRALTAVFKYLVMGTIGATFYLIGVGLLYMMTATLNLADLEQRVGGLRDTRPVLASAGFITLGLGLKAALFPLHAWLPNAYQRAPHMVTVFLAACATKVAIYVLMRFDFTIFHSHLDGRELRFTALLIPLALLGMLVGSAIPMFERDLKRLLAWSSIGQIGYILLGIGLASTAGLAASVTHMFAHALAKGTVFLGVAALAVRFGGLELTRLAGAFRTMPWTAAAFVIGGLSLIGVPGTAGFVSKWLLIGAALEHGPWGVPLVAAILVTSLMAVVYVWRVVETAAFGTPGDDAPPPGEAPVALLAALFVGALANVWFGFSTELPVDLASRAAEALVGSADGR